MEYINTVFDVILVLVSIWMVIVIRSSSLGGVFGNTLTWITAGAIVLGVAHLIETLTFEVFHMQDLALGELLHRMIVLAGFGSLVMGFQGLRQLRRA